LANGLQHLFGSEFLRVIANVEAVFLIIHVEGRDAWKP
jgi:hypothetical protein